MIPQLQVVEEPVVEAPIVVPPKVEDPAPITQNPFVAAAAKQETQNPFMPKTKKTSNQKQVPKRGR